MIKEIECKITGRVHGVMFRDFTKREARKGGLVGTVENQNDGSVRVIAQGEETSLQDFLLEIKKGPTLAKIENLSVIWREPSGKFEDFKIIFRNFLDRF